MIFTTVQHYDIVHTDNTENNNDNNDDECFICYEIKDRENKNPIKFGRQNKYLIRCSCNVCVHILCLDEWYAINQSCPICRKNIIINTYKTKTCLLVVKVYKCIIQTCVLTLNISCNAIAFIIGVYLVILYLSVITNVLAKVSFLSNVIPEQM